MTTAQFRYHVCAGPGALEQSPCSLVANGSWEKQARCTRVRRDANRKVFVQSKFTVDDTSWGQAFYPWTDDAPRPNGRITEPGFSGLLPSDVVLAPNKPLSEARTKELRAALQDVRLRLPDAAWEEIQKMLEIVTTPRTEVMPDGYGVLGGDFLEHNEEQPGEAQLFARATLCSRHSHTRPVPVSNAEHRGTQANPSLSTVL